MRGMRLRHEFTEVVGTARCAYCRLSRADHECVLHDDDPRPRCHGLHCYVIMAGRSVCGRPIAYGWFRENGSLVASACAMHREWLSTWCAGESGPVGRVLNLAKVPSALELKLAKVPDRMLFGVQNRAVTR